MGFDVDIAKEAADKYPKNKRNKAIEHALKSQKDIKEIIDIAPQSPYSNTNNNVSFDDVKDEQKKKDENKTDQDETKEVENILNRYRTITIQNVKDHSIEDCLSLERLVEVLKCYKLMQDDDNDKIVQDTESYFNQKKANIINDYHHVLQQHLTQNDDDEIFKKVYNILINDNGLKCGIDK